MAALIVFAVGTGAAGAADQPPVAVGDQLNLNEDAPATAVDVLANDEDPDGGEMTIESAGTPEHGTATVTGGGTGLTYAPAHDYCGADAFDYTLNGGSTATVTVAVTCLGDPPTAVNDHATLDEDAPATSIPVLANDTDVDGGPIAIVSVGIPTHGVTAITGGGTGLTYRPAANECFDPQSFTYTLNGGSKATVTVDIICIDDLPRGADDTVSLREDDPATELPVLDNDPDIDPGEKAIESATQPSHGTIAITGDGSILTYEPDADYCGPDSFAYTLNGNSSATVTIAIACIDDLPVARDDSPTVEEDADAILVAVLANDADPDGGPRLIVRRGNADHGAVGSAGSGTGLFYAPAPDYCGPDSFTYTLNGGTSATVAVTVNCVDDPPVAVPDSVAIREDARKARIKVLVNDTDIDGGRLRIASSTKPHHGRASIRGALIGYKPKPGYCGPDSFSYVLNGGARAVVKVWVKCRPHERPRSL